MANTRMEDSVGNLEKAVEGLSERLTSWETRMDDRFDNLETLMKELLMLSKSKGKGIQATQNTNRPDPPPNQGSQREFTMGKRSKQFGHHTHESTDNPIYSTSQPILHPPRHHQHPPDPFWFQQPTQNYPYTDPPNRDRYFQQPFGPPTRTHEYPFRKVVQPPLRHVEDEEAPCGRPTRAPPVRQIDGMKQGCFQVPDLPKSITTELDLKSEVGDDLIHLQPGIDEVGLNEETLEVETKEVVVEAQGERDEAHVVEAQLEGVGRTNGFNTVDQRRATGALTGSHLLGSAISTPTPSLQQPESSTIAHQSWSTVVEVSDPMSTAAGDADRSAGRSLASRFPTTGIGDSPIKSQNRVIITTTARATAGQVDGTKLMVIDAGPTTIQQTKQSSSFHRWVSRCHWIFQCWGLSRSQENMGIFEAYGEIEDTGGMANIDERNIVDRNSGGLLYWASAIPGRKPPVIVEGNLTLQQEAKVVGNCLGLTVNQTCFPYSQWRFYTHAEIDELNYGLKDYDPKERELKETILQWQNLLKIQAVVQLQVLARKRLLQELEQDCPISMQKIVVAGFTSKLGAAAGYSGATSEGAYVDKGVLLQNTVSATRFKDSKQLPPLHFYALESDQPILDILKPSVVVVYHPNMNFVREIEVYKAEDPSVKLKVYFLFYKETTEVQEFEASIRRENGAFESWIRQKSLKMIPVDQDGRCLGLNSSTEAQTTTFQNAVTRKAGGRKEVFEIVLISLDDGIWSKYGNSLKGNQPLLSSATTLQQLRGSMEWFGDYLGLASQQERSFYGLGFDEATIVEVAVGVFLADGCGFVLTINVLLVMRRSFERGFEQASFHWLPP